MTPDMDRWRTLPAEPVAARSRCTHTATWTDGELIVWGGHACREDAPYLAGGSALPFESADSEVVAETDPPEVAATDPTPTEPSPAEEKDPQPYPGAERVAVATAPDGFHRVRLNTGGDDMPGARVGVAFATPGGGRATVVTLLKDPGELAPTLEDQVDTGWTDINDEFPDVDAAVMHRPGDGDSWQLMTVRDDLILNVIVPLDVGADELRGWVRRLLEGLAQ